MTSGSEDAELMKLVYAEVSPPQSPLLSQNTPPKSVLRVSCECRFTKRVESAHVMMPLTTSPPRRPLQAASLKSREASSENVLRVAKETLDARKRQIRTLTASLKKAHVQLMTLKRHEEDRGESHGSATVSLAEVDLEEGIDPEDDGIIIDGSEEEGAGGPEEKEGADEKTGSN